MSTTFAPNALPVLIGSLPVSNHEEAIKLVFQYTPEIPLWSQLPSYKKAEGMMFQFLPGMPGLTIREDRWFMDTSNPEFEQEVLAFYEEYMAVSEGGKSLSESRFVLTQDTAEGFFVFLKKINAVSPDALKGQITGPVTLTIGTKDQNGRAIFYNEQLRDIAIKMIGLKARYQVREMKSFGKPAIVFFDEPGLAGFGSSEMITMTEADVTACFREVIDEVHKEGGLAGIHVCANADWHLILDSSVDILSFDAYSFFDKLMLYGSHLKRFIESGRIVAWGIVPTLTIADIESETADSLMVRWENIVKEIAKLGIDKNMLIRQSLITPSCGTGSLKLHHALKVLDMTKEISRRIRLC